MAGRKRTTPEDPFGASEPKRLRVKNLSGNSERDIETMTKVTGDAALGKETSTLTTEEVHAIDDEESSQTVRQATRLSRTSLN